MTKTDLLYCTFIEEKIRQHKKQMADDFKTRALNHHKRSCKECSSESDLTIHHKNGKGDQRMESLEVLCRDCHDKVHGFKKRVRTTQ